VTIGSQIRALLREGPSTSAEITATLGMPRRGTIRGHLSSLKKHGHVRIEGWIRPPKHKPQAIWALTPRGEARARK